MSRPREFDLGRALHTAMRMFWQRGYNGVSIAELSAAMNISAPSLYAAFGSKQDLYRQSLRAYQERPNAVTPEALASEQPLRQSLAELIHCAIETATELSPSTGCMVATGFLTGSSDDAPAAELPAALRRALLNALHARLQQAIDDGEISGDYAAGTLARYLIAVISGISVQARDGASRMELQQFATFAVQAIVPNIGKGRTGRRSNDANVSEAQPHSRRQRARSPATTVPSKRARSKARRPR